MSLSCVQDIFTGAKNHDDVKSALNAFQDFIQPETGELWVCYVQVFRSSLERPLTYLFNQFPEAWQARYEAKKYHLIDPSWDHAKHSTIPFSWSDLSGLTKEQKDMTLDANRHGLRSGVLVPFHGRSGYSLLWVMSPLAEEYSKGYLVDSKISSYQILPFIYEAVRSIVFSGKSILTRREKEALYWVGEGLNTDEVSEKLFISPATVEKHISNSCKKLEARNRTQCVSIATNLGLVVPGDTSFNFKIKG